MGNFLKLMSHAREFFGIKIFAFGILTGIGNSILIAAINETIKKTTRSIGELSILFIIYFLVLMSYFLLQYFYQALLIKISENIICKNRLDIIDRIRHSEYSRFEQLGESRIYSVLSRDSYSIGTIVNVVLTSLISIVTIIGSLLYLLYLSSNGFLLIISVVCISLLISLKQQKINIDRIKKTLQIEETFFTYLKDALYGAKELKSDAAASYDLFENFLIPEAIKYKDERISGLVFQNRFSLLGSLNFFITIGLILFIYPFFGILHINDLSQVIIIALYLLSPIQVLLPLIPEFSYINASIERIQILREELVNEKYYDSNDKEFETLSLQDVHFQYPTAGGQTGFSIGPVNLLVNKGDIIVIYGGNASGKSTLIKIIVGLYKISTGSIWINGEQLVSADVQKYRDKFSVIFTDNYLFQTLYGLNDVSSERSTDLINLMRLKNINISQKKFNRINLSEGQKKRLALIYVLLRNKSVLILDEWAANQDPEFRHYFYKEFIPILKAQNKTIILITHDDKYFDVAQKIFKMEYGKLYDVTNSYYK